MDPREKILHAFDKVAGAETITNHLVFEFLKDLHHHVNDGIFIIGEKEDFTVKRVEGATFFDAHARVLHVGNSESERPPELFETLVSMMQYYQFSSDHPGEGAAFKRNPDRKLALDYTAAAITRYFLGDFSWPEPELEAIMRERGLIDELAVIKAFSRRLAWLVEYEGDFVTLLDKLAGAIAIFQEIQGDTGEDAAMLATIEATADAATTAVDEEKERDTFLQSLLNGLTLD